LTPPTPVLLRTDVDQRAAAAGALTRAELRAIAAGLAADPAPWRHLVRHDPEQRVFERLRLDDLLEVWLICWMPGHDTGFHDHDLSSGAVVVTQGAVVEERLRIAAAPAVRRYGPGDVFDFSPSEIHRVAHAGTTPATTLHAYSPPLRRMGAYRVEPGGVLQRHPLAKDEELRPLTVTSPS
jgi:predicted metal-dependent enzyme (double-stranded beta helix superfamily)